MGDNAKERISWSETVVGDESLPFICYFLNYERDSDYN